LEDEVQDMKRCAVIAGLGAAALPDRVLGQERARRSADEVIEENARTTISAARA
jgi:hypothetical protein